MALTAFCFHNNGVFFFLFCRIVVALGAYCSAFPAYFSIFVMGFLDKYAQILLNETTVRIITTLP